MVTYNLKGITTRAELLQHWLKRYRGAVWCNAPVVSAAMALIEESYVEQYGTYSWTADGIEEDLIQDYSRHICGLKSIHFKFHLLNTKEEEEAAQ